MSPYRTVLIRASDGAVEAATVGWDFGTRAERARDRSIYPACGSGVKGAAGGARGGAAERSETSYSPIGEPDREGVNSDWGEGLYDYEVM